MAVPCAAASRCERDAYHTKLQKLVSRHRTRTTKLTKRPGFVPRAAEPKETMMSKTETGKIDNARTARMLRDDELDVVSGGLNLYECLISGVVARRSERGDFIATS
jgi:hypothetical protein